MKQLKFPSFIPMLAVFFLLSCSDGSKKTDSEDTTPVNASDDGWVSLFNGKDLAGWQVCEGTAPYIVEDGEIVGTTAPDNPNGMLCTVDTFSNFFGRFFGLQWVCRIPGSSKFWRLVQFGNIRIKVLDGSFSKFDKILGLKPPG